ncbi:MAG: homoserine O-acetyltransferase [Anaerolineales bacterium]
MVSARANPFFDRARSVGLVQRQYATFDFPLILTGGEALEAFQIAYETYGQLNAARSNVILICHALSGDAHVAGYHQLNNPDEKPGWWDSAVGPGKMFDTNHFFVICSNVIGGCQGSTGPSTRAPDGQPYALRFPIITIADMVAAQRHLLDYLGIEQLFAVVGGSMGGMQALQWAVAYPERVRNCILLATTACSSAQQIAFNEVGRQAIYADPHWNEGNYYRRGHPLPVAGLSVARMVAHITYMSDRSMQDKFGRNWQDESKRVSSFDSPDFAVESYLRYQGEKFVNRFDANSYLYITKALDLFDIGADYGSLREALKRTQCHFLVMSFSSDWLYTLGQALDTVQTLAELGRPVEHHHVESHFGHDSFLVEVELMTHIVGGWVTNRWQAEQAPAD